MADDHERSTQAPDAARVGAKLRFTEGPVGRTLLLFAMPTLVSSILQSMNASINAAWIAHLLGTRALTASANANSLLFFLLGAVFGLTLASTVLVGQSVGAGDEPGAKRAIGTSLVFFGALSICMATVGAALAPRVVDLVGTPTDAVPLAVAYLRVSVLGLPPLVLFTFVMTALRGAGDAKTPLAFLFWSALIDVALNPLLIRGAGAFHGFGIAGSALATLIAQWAGLVALVSWLYWRRHPLRLGRGEGRYLRIDIDVLRSLVLKGVPMGLSVVVMSASMIAMISLVNRNGSSTTAAYGACFQLWNYIQLPSLALGTAVSAMVAQNIGAKRWDRVARIARDGIVFNLGLTAMLVVILSILSERAFSLLLGQDAASIQIAEHIHAVVSWSFVMFGVSFVLTSVVRAAGAVMAPLGILFVSLWVVRIPFAYAFTEALHADAIWWSFPVGTFVLLLLSVAYYQAGWWRQAQVVAVAHHHTPVCDPRHGPC
jgi:putative MATE family efflux protein